jgi:hypothetical protein
VSARATTILAATAFVALGACSSATMPLVDAARDTATDARDPSAEAIARFCDLFAVCARPGMATDSPGCAQSIAAFAYDDTTVAARQAADRFVFGCTGATNCDAFLSCLLGGRSPSYCGAHPGNSCDGDTLVTCSAMGSFAIDCAGYGLRCVSSSGGAACSDGSSCSSAGVGAECQGNRLVMCGSNASFISGADCSLFMNGGVCVPSGSSASCVPSATCSIATSSPQCEGTAAVWCVSGHERRVDCASVANGRCAAPDGGAASTLTTWCVPSGAVCDPRTSVDRCNGNAIESCVQGRWIDVDCASLGLRTCGAVAGGVTCVP